MSSEAMQAAIDSAYEGIRAKEGGPFGASVVKDGKVIYAAHNTVLKDKDPTCHAEMNAIRGATKVLDTHILEDCELYTTVEPCPMCLSAIYWARIKKVHVGARKDCAAKYGFDDVYFYEQVNLPWEERELDYERDILPDACEKVFTEWQSLEGIIY